MNNAEIWVGLVACLLGGYFSACNIAIKIFSRARLSDMLEDRVSEEKLSLFLDRSMRIPLLTGTLRSFFNLVVLLAVYRYLDRQMTQWSFIAKGIVSLLVSGAAVSLVSVAIASSWARYKPEALLAWSIPLLGGLMVLFAPLVMLLHGCDPVVRRILGVAADDEQESDVSEEVMSVVEEHQGEGAVDADQKEMIEAVFDLSDTLAGEIMTPRTDIEGISYGLSLNEVRDTIIRAGHSRIPVYGKDLDDIMGFLYAKDLIHLVNADDLSGFDLKPMLREAMIVPETKSVRDLLSEFKATKVHIAIVLDEYGGTAGLVTIEDILEELVGEIEDEYEPDEDKPSIRRLDDRTVEVDARVYMDDLNDELDLALPEDEDYDTVGGFVFSTLGHIPDKGESFEYENIRMTVLDAEKTKVLKVNVEILESDSGANSNGQSNGNGRRHHSHRSNDSED